MQIVKVDWKIILMWVKWSYKSNIYTEIQKILPWKELDVDIAMECTGIFTSREKASTAYRSWCKDEF